MGRILQRPAKFGYINAKCRALKSSLLKREFFERAERAEGVGDIFALLKGTAYSPYISDSGKDALIEGIEASFFELYGKSITLLNKNEKRVFDLFFIERAKLAQNKLFLADASSSFREYREFDAEYIGNIKDALKNLDSSVKRDLLKIVGSYFDLMNLYTLVRLRVLYALEVEEIVPFFIPYGYRFDIASLSSFSAVTTLSELSESVHKRVGGTFSSFDEFKIVLASYHMDLLREVWYGYPFKLSVIFSLLRMKEIESRKLRALVEGIFYRLPPEEIQKMVEGV